MECVWYEGSPAAIRGASEDLSKAAVEDNEQALIKVADSVPIVGSWQADVNKAGRSLVSFAWPDK